MRIHPVNELPSTIILGRQTETGVNEVRLDCAEWLALWPELKISIMVTPPGGSEAYPAAANMEGDVLVWLVNSSDTAVVGSGTMEVLGVADGQRKLSAIATTRILPTTTAQQGEVPEYARPWVDQVILAGEGAKADAQAAAKSASAAETAKADADAQATAAGESAKAAAKSATDAAESVKDVFIVKVGTDKLCSHTKQEIVGAASSGKLCLMVYYNGEVLKYKGLTKYGEETTCPYFVGSVYKNASNGEWYASKVTVLGDNKTVFDGSNIRVANPNPLRFTGAVEATYNGSEHVTINIPNGALPETADPHTQLVTDKDGKVAWEERLAWKEVTTEKGYVYVYQDAEMVSDDGLYLLTPPISSPVAGETYTVIIGGNEYTSKCVDASALTEGTEAYAFGNKSALSDELPIENPDPDAEYFIMLMPGGSEGVYGVVFVNEEPAPPTLTVRSTEEVETTTTDIKKVDRELLDVATPDMNAGYDEEGYIKNRPCWVYETEKGRIRWDGVFEGKETLYMTINGETHLVGYKVCPVPMTMHTFVNRLSSYCYTYPVNEDGSSAGTKRIINKMELVIPGLYAFKQLNTGKELYYSFNADETGNSLATFSGSTGIYIAPEFVAEVDAPCIDWVTGNIYAPLSKEMLPPATTYSADNNVYYWRWSPSANAWQTVTTDWLKDDFGFVDVVATADGTTITAMSKSFDVVNAAVQAGKVVRLNIGSGWMHCSHTTGNEVEFYTIMGTMLYRVIYSKDGTATLSTHPLVAD